MEEYSSIDTVVMVNITEIIDLLGGKMLTFKFTPGDIEIDRNLHKNISNILSLWSSSDYTMNDMDNNAFHLSSDRMGNGTWHHLKSIITNKLITSKPISCTLPDTATIEYEGIFASIVDLSGFAGLSNIYCFIQLIEVAVTHGHVFSVTLESRPTLLNYAASGVLQSGTVEIEPFTEAGLTGEGQIVGVADSGLSDLSCFFYDNTNYYYSTQTTRSTVDNPVVESYRRKVVQYIANADGVDGEGGHGTHVCGSIVGNSLSSLFSKGNGIVPMAKIAFLDLQIAGTSYVVVPDLYSYVYRNAYNAGARIFSHSWGSSTSGMRVYYIII